MRLYLEIIILIVFAVCLFFYLGRKWLINEAKKEVVNAPKIPMAMCDKHGLLPSDSMLKTTAVAVGRPDLEVELCPICFYERTNAAKEKLMQ